MDSTTTTPIYFILSPGANVVGDLDKLADKYEFVKNESYHNVSMGQGQVYDCGICKARQGAGWEYLLIGLLCASMQPYSPRLLEDFFPTGYPLSGSSCNVMAHSHS